MLKIRKRGISMKRMKALLVNDDGIHAEGLALFKRHLEKYFDVYVAAPLHEQSAKSHSITIRRLFHIEKFDDKTYAVDGTPADCVKFGLHQWPDVDIVFSGVNDGPNLANDIFYSGTVAGASEATFNGKPGVAMSCGYRGSFDIVDREIDTVIEYIIENELYSSKYALNVNFPTRGWDSIEGFKITKQGVKDFRNVFIEREDGYENIYEVTRRNHDQDSDIWAIINGYVSITPLVVDRTDKEVLSKLKK
jgi:5'-nucleotidase